MTWYSPAMSPNVRLSRPRMAQRPGVAPLLRVVVPPGRCDVTERGLDHPAVPWLSCDSRSSGIAASAITAAKPNPAAHGIEPVLRIAGQNCPHLGRPEEFDARRREHVCKHMAARAGTTASHSQTAARTTAQGRGREEQQRCVSVQWPMW